MGAPSSSPVLRERVCAGTLAAHLQTAGRSQTCSEGINASTLLLAALGMRAAVPFGNAACVSAESAAPAAAETDEGTGATLAPLLPKPGGGTRFGAAEGRPSLPLVPATPAAGAALSADAAAASGVFCPFWRCRLLPSLPKPA